MNEPGMICNEACTRYIMELTTELGELKTANEMMLQANSELIRSIKELEAKRQWWKDTATKSDKLVKYKISYIETLEVQVANLQSDAYVLSLLCKINELEAQGAVDRATCRWCGTIHARKMNILCPLTIAEAKLDAVKNCRRYIDLGGDSIQESPTGEYMLTNDVLKAIGEQE